MKHSWSASGLVAAAGLASAAVAWIVAACSSDTFVDGDATPDAGAEVFALDGNTAQCDASSRVPDDQAAWVSATLGDDTSPCTRTASCRTIAAGLLRAKQQGLHALYLDNATYNESLVLSAAFTGLTIQGGWVSGTSDWIASCDDTTTQIIAPDDAGVTVDIEAANGVVLRLLTVESKATGSAGESVYAVRVADSQNVVLDNVALLARQAGRGIDGLPGGTDGGCTSKSSGPGSTGAIGALGAPGAFDPSGYVPGSAGNGTSGALGSSGPGASGMCGSNCMVGCISGGSCSFGTDCAGTGGPGCAGYGGGGGSGGAGGGASIALFATNASVALFNGGLLVGSGGAGGNGGVGGAPAPGAQGDAGYSTGCYSCTPNTCNTSLLYNLDGGAGGAGGPGGAGGQGGGGAGGPTYFWAALDASVAASPETLAASKFLGAPGAGGLPNGQSGASAVHP